MAKFNVVDKKVNMSLEEIIKFQIMTYCYIHKITLSESDLACLTLLGLNKKVELSDFCNACCDPENRDKDSAISYQKSIFCTNQISNFLWRDYVCGIFITCRWVIVNSFSTKIINPRCYAKRYS